MSSSSSSSLAPVHAPDSIKLCELEHATLIKVYEIECKGKMCPVMQRQEDGLFYVNPICKMYDKEETEKDTNAIREEDEVEDEEETEKKKKVKSRSNTTVLTQFMRQGPTKELIKSFTDIGIQAAGKITFGSLSQHGTYLNIHVFLKLAAYLDQLIPGKFVLDLLSKMSQLSISNTNNQALVVSNINTIKSQLIHMNEHHESQLVQYNQQTALFNQAMAMMQAEVSKKEARIAELEQCEANKEKVIARYDAGMKAKKDQIKRMQEIYSIQIQSLIERNGELDKKNKAARVTLEASAKEVEQLRKKVDDRIIPRIPHYVL